MIETGAVTGVAGGTISLAAVGGVAMKRCRLRSEVTTGTLDLGRGGRREASKLERTGRARSLSSGVGLSGMLST
jgi:hypothetical protein